MLAVDATPELEKLQVLDFLVAGDIVSAMTAFPTNKISLRAISSSSLVALDPPEASADPLVHAYRASLMQRAFHQMARLSMHQLMMGRLESEARVASFILYFALTAKKTAAGIPVALPMSRNDIANYLVINCDTLSRIMMSLCDSGVIERENRHAIRVLDLEALKKKTPIAALMSAQLAKQADAQPAPSILPRAALSLREPASAFSPSSFEGQREGSASRHWLGAADRCAPLR
jgi:CRP-like cAMP-binding protein